MSDKLKNQAILRDFKQQMLNKYGSQNQDIVNSEILKMIAKKNLETKDLNEIESMIKKRLKINQNIIGDVNKKQEILTSPSQQKYEDKASYVQRFSSFINSKIRKKQSRNTSLKNPSTVSKITASQQSDNNSSVLRFSKPSISKYKSINKTTISDPKASIINPASSIQRLLIDDKLESVSNILNKESELDKYNAPSPKLDNKSFDANQNSISLPKINGFNNPQESYNLQLPLNQNNSFQLQSNQSRFLKKSLYKRYMNHDRQSDRHLSFNSSLVLNSGANQNESNGQTRNDYQQLELPSDLSRVNQSVILSNGSKLNNKDQQLSIWDVMRIHDSKKFQIEQYQKKLKKLEHQKELKQFLQQQVQNRNQSLQSIDSSQKIYDREQINNSITKLKEKEEQQQVIRKQQLLQSVEYNIQNKTQKGLKLDKFLEQQQNHSQTPSNVEGLHVLFKLDQQKKQELQKQKLETQNLLKNLITTKERIRKNEYENSIALDYMTVKRTDDWLKKSTDDYKALVQSKDARNQLIIQAHNARGIRNYSTIEQEKYNSIDRIVEQQEQEIIKRESSIIDEKQKIMIKLKEDLKNSQLKQIEECRNKRLQEKNYNKTVEDQLINRSINDYQEYQIKSKLEKFQKQQQMKQELEVLMRLRKEQAQENKLLLNPIEFSMNKRSLKELGIENFHDQYEEVLSPGQIQQF